MTMIWNLFEASNT